MLTLWHLGTHAFLLTPFFFLFVFFVELLVSKVRGTNAGGKVEHFIIDQAHKHEHCKWSLEVFMTVYRLRVQICQACQITDVAIDNNL